MRLRAEGQRERDREREREFSAQGDRQTQIHTSACAHDLGTRMHVHFNKFKKYILQTLAGLLYDSLMYRPTRALLTWVHLGHLLF